MSLDFSTKCLEFLMNESVFPTKGLRMFKRSLDTSLQTESRELTMGLKGTPGLWIFGKPYMCGVLECCEFSRSLCLSEKYFLCFLRTLAKFLSKLSVGSLVNSVFFLVNSVSLVNSLSDGKCP